ncbi:MULTISPECIES: hypothetical protein [unclassified Bradyrhizobium]|uniref:hypothetical protein n=1 Tax=unclassified Bradyrhizobium TaxID=2631580 RepID=UPI002916172E|nr:MULTISPECIES: hypothetical protein [unclassified Bradyrhizobium]
MKYQHPGRLRAQEQNHVRSIELQTLDAMLRIEEQLMVLNSRLAPSHTDLMLSPEAVEEATKVEEKPAPRRGRK